MGIGGAVPGGAEVDAGGAGGVASYGGGVDAVRADRVDQVVAEAVGADAADPAHGVSGGGEHARHVGLGSADAAVEGRYVGEAPGYGGHEGDHGLAERDDIHGCVVRGGGGSGGGHGGSGSSWDLGSCRGDQRLR